MHTADGVHGVNSGAPLSAPRPDKVPKYVQDPIAVVGMACRLPGNSNSPHALWKFLEQGGIADNEAPASRFNLKGHFDGSRRPKTMRSPGGMFLEHIDPQEFDAPFFGISKADAIAMDPQQRQLLEVVYECLENAGVTMEAIDGAPIGCFVGSYGVDYADMQARDPEDRAPSVTIGIGRAILSNRISHFFNIKGPSMTIDTACSGSLVAVDVACRYLQTLEIDGAVVAGGNLYLSPEHNLDSGAMKGASSLSGKCHTFDVKADGYIKAEGVNAVLLKRLSDAIRDKDVIRAVIRGTATNSDGRTPGIASPSAEAQAVAIRAAYANAGLTEYNETKYLECHGTGTQAGDLQEVQGIASVFSHARPLDEPLIIGSIKSNIGHSEPAAGISGLLKAILIVENGIIPGNPTFITPNPKIDFHNLRIQATRTAILWPRGTIRRASVNSFGYGGSNAHVVVEEPKMLVPESALIHKSSYASTENFFDDDDVPVSPSPHVLVFSANKETSLQSYIRAIRKHLLDPNVKIQLPDLAYTLSERRTRHFNRAYFVARNLDLDEASIYYGKKGNEAPRVGFVFTGQGAQWAQMGKELVDLFPNARLLLQHFDDVLQSCSMPPSWSLLDELTKPRSPEALRQPEFSQPLVTALQLILLAILREWGVMGVHGVVGHSSGEIAAAYAAGLLSQEDAIIVAYYRGQAAKMYGSGNPTVGMLAVGLGADQVRPHIQDFEESVQIACYNSPTSVTLSGKLEDLEIIKSRLSDESHFARLLQVDLAYHSKFMADIGKKYREMLSKDFSSRTRDCGSISMFSTVLGRKIDQPANVEYWVANLMSPVKFNEAVREMVSNENGIDFLIEIGPSGALAGPLSQIIKSAGAHAAKTQYCSSLKRGQNSVNSLFEVAGRLFVSGGQVNFSKVNAVGDGPNPALIVDLPNYSWDHSIKYWYENDSSKDWRNRLFPHHDLVGSKILGTSWHAPSWRQILRLENLPWLKDHKMASEIIFPGAGFVALAVEGVRQKHLALSILEGTKAIERAAFRIRDVTFPKALVLTDGEEGTKIMLSFAPAAKAQNLWHEFKIFSLLGNVWTEHCHGLVRIEEDKGEIASGASIAPLMHPVPGQLWYKAMHDAGYNFGPLFQRQLQVESVSGKRHSRSTVSLEEVISEAPQSQYPMHPINIDGCFQTCAPSLWNGNRSSVNAVMIPAIIGEILITSAAASASKGISVTTARHNRLGRIEETKNFISEASVYDPDTGNLLFRISGFRYHKLETGDSPYAKHTYSCLRWKPDITHLTQEGLDSLLKTSAGPNDAQDGVPGAVQDVLDLFAHKQPSLKVLELNMIPGDGKALWLQASPSDKSVRAACSRYAYVSIDAASLIKVQEKHETSPNHEFLVVDMARSMGPFSANDPVFDLAIVRVPSSTPHFASIVDNARTLLRPRGQIMTILHRPTSIDVNGVAVHLGVQMTNEHLQSKQHPANGLIVHTEDGTSKTSKQHKEHSENDIQFHTKNGTTHAAIQSTTPIPNGVNGNTHHEPALEPANTPTNGTKHTPLQSETPFINSNGNAHQVPAPAPVYDTINGINGNIRDGTICATLKALANDTSGNALNESPPEPTNGVVNCDTSLMEGSIATTRLESASVNGDCYEELKSRGVKTNCIAEARSQNYFNGGVHTNIRHLQFAVSQCFESLTLSILVDDTFRESDKVVSVIHFSPLLPAALDVIERLTNFGWSVSCYPAYSALAESKAARIVVLDELSTALFPNMQDEGWKALRDLTLLGKRILWVTKGSQMKVTDPDRAMVFGLGRTVRAEDPSVSITCLDVENESGPQTSAAIDGLLKSLDGQSPKTRIENEYVERNGIIYISRIQPDHIVNTAEKGNVSEESFMERSLHDCETLIRVRCERLGHVDSLIYAEVATEELPIGDNCIEVEIATAGLNFKDIAVTMGIVPENQYLLGLEGAGTIRRLGKAVDSYSIGQRVLVFEKGTFANRIEATTERVHAIPDSMTFEEAATLASVYLTSLYSIFDLANTQKGQSVLIHSASGGLGIACIQICQYIGAEIFVTVGTKKKRQFIKDTFRIPDDHIFNSRTTAFAPEIMRLTEGYGIDVILNSLTGDLLDASWRCIAEGGTMVELGKKDMLDRKSLAMEPFGRNASYRCFDMAHKHVSDTLIARLLAQLFDLLDNGHVRPIDPIQTFPFEEIQSAFRYMRGANHIGKVVISNHGNNDIKVSVRPAPTILRLKHDASYLLVGGLKGLCGSLAIDLARSGARNLVVISRSGYGDARSQGILENIYSEGCKVDLVQGDVCSLYDVRKAFKTASLPVKGVIQGAMVLKDKLFTSMTIEEYTQAVQPKVQGTWNLHNVALEEDLQLDFFTMLSSVSGVVGQKGQANYAAANAFLDSFASYRRSQDLAACSVDLGAIDDVGYMSEHKDILATLESAAWTPINEALFLRIVRVSILQQVDTINHESVSQMVTSIAVPQMKDSYLMADARFSGLCFGFGSELGSKSDGKSKAIQSFMTMIKAGAVTSGQGSVVQAAVEILNHQFITILRLSEPMEPAKPLSSYGLDSLAAVELRNWVRTELGVDITVLDITNAPSLVSLAEKVVSRLAAETNTDGTQKEQN